MVVAYRLIRAGEERVVLGLWDEAPYVADFTQRQLDASFAAPSAHISAIDLF